MNSVKYIAYTKMAFFPLFLDPPQGTMNHAKSLCAILQGPQKNIYRKTPSISTFTSI